MTTKPNPTIEQIAVLCLGKVGLLAAKLLHNGAFNVVGLDLMAPSETLPFPVERADVTSTKQLRDQLRNVDAVLSCLPYQHNIGVADIAAELGVHYFDLTEDVQTTNHIRKLAESASALMAPQCGLAPGFVGIVAASQIASFGTCRSVRMRVGALPRHPTGLLGYAFNWSPEGVVNEYLNDCEVIEEGEHKWVSPMEWHETIYVDGVKLEAFTTSGGLGTMCETFAGRVANLDYKTMRYPGHMELMNFFFHELLMRDDRVEAGRILTKAKPPVSEDVVYVHVSSEGTLNGQLRRQEFVRAYTPNQVSGGHNTAIAWTTAGSVVAIIEMVRDGLLPAQGFLKQEDVPLDAFLATRTGSLYAQ